MNINFLPFLIGWVILDLVVVVLYFKHRALARQEDAGLNVLASANAAQHHMALEQKLEGVDKWGKLLTILSLVYGLVLAGLYLAQTWEQSSRIGV